MGLAFLEEEAAIGGEVAPGFDAAGGPADFDRVGFGGRAQAEMEPGVGGRLIAAARESLGDLAEPTRVHRDGRADRVALGGGRQEGKC